MFKMKTFFVVTISFLLGIIATQPYYTKVIHNTDPNAKCLDGSGPMIYLHEGGDTKNILFYFLGGGACTGVDLPSTLEACYQRSQSRFGTSTVWPDYSPSAGFGLLQTDPAISKFWNWTKIVIMYCDGAFHQGNNENPVQYKGSLLYFRGAVNTRSHFKFADLRYNLSNAERIVLSGGSAGGMATAMWISYMKSLVPQPDRVYGIVDSGILYDPLMEYWSQELETLIVELSNVTQLLTLKYGLPPQIQLLMALANVNQPPPNKQCVDVYPASQTWACIFPQFSYPTFQSKLLFVNSNYDSDDFNYFLSFVKCLSYGVTSYYTLDTCSPRQQRAIQLYRTFFVRKLIPRLYRQGHSFWTISCSWHAQMFNTTYYDSPLQQVPMNSGNTMKKAVESFVFNNKRVVNIDLLSWPANTPCAY